MASGCVIVSLKGCGPVKNVSYLLRVLSSWAQSRINLGFTLNVGYCKITKPFNTYWNQVDSVKPAESFLPLKGNDYLFIHRLKWYPEAKEIAKPELQFSKTATRLIVPSF